MLVRVLRSIAEGDLCIMGKTGTSDRLKPVKCHLASELLVHRQQAASCTRQTTHWWPSAVCFYAFHTQDAFPRLQEHEHLRLAVERIMIMQPDVLLVEKSVARFAQEMLLGKGVALILNVKPSLLERLARCTGAQVQPCALSACPQGNASCWGGLTVPVGVFKRGISVC